MFNSFFWLLPFHFVLSLSSSLLPSASLRRPHQVAHLTLPLFASLLSAFCNNSMKLLLAFRYEFPCLTLPAASSYITIVKIGWSFFSASSLTLFIFCSFPALNLTLCNRVKLGCCDFSTIANAPHLLPRLHPRPLNRVKICLLLFQHHRHSSQLPSSALLFSCPQHLPLIRVKIGWCYFIVSSPLLSSALLPSSLSAIGYRLAAVISALFLTLLVSFLAPFE